jgi:hypothetical protein
VRFHQHDSWVTCSLRFNDRWSEQWLPHRFTWLYFYDEAVAFAAGHRPCAECRRADYKRYQAAWADAFGGEPPSAREMNRRLHSERIVRGTHRRQLHTEAADGLPDGAFIELDGAPYVIVGCEAVEWTRAGYRTRRPPAERRRHGDHPACDARRPARRLPGGDPPVGPRRGGGHPAIVLTDSRRASRARLCARGRVARDGHPVPVSRSPAQSAGRCWCRRRRRDASQCATPSSSLESATSSAMASTAG